ncbi:MAG: hypothetical protein ABI395_11715 [Sphingobium sp.]
MTETDPTIPPVPASSDAATDAWLKFAHSLGVAGAAILAEEGPGRDAAQQAELTESMIYALVAGLLSFVNMDRDRPQFLPLLNSRLRRYATNADTVYLHALINGAGSYRIVGRRGTATMLCIQIISGNMGFTDVAVHSQLIIPLPHPGATDELDILVSAERPAAYDGLWLELDRTRAEQFISVRYVATDWATEIDPQLAIEPLHCSMRQPRNEPLSVLDRLQLVGPYMQGVTAELMGVMRTQLASVGAVNQAFNVTHLLPTIAGQSYTHGVIEIGPDEAWIAECEVQEGMTYWSSQLLDFAYSTLDSTTRQCATNSDIGRVDPDGKIRIVVCDRDPGVANWLDKSGYGKVQIRCRWLGVSHPEIQSQVVPIDQLDAFLPAGVARIELEEREALLRKRSLGAQMRRLW